MESRFTALRVIAIFFKILAWIALIFGLIGAVAALLVGFTLSGQQGLLGLDLSGPLAGIAMFVVVLIVSLIIFMIYYAIGESIYLFLSLEENTRRTAYLLQQQYTSRQSGYTAPAGPPPDYSD
jgi:ABC-type long-subunit fatty acid transport system fused permease/ATPase subunit